MVGSWHCHTNVHYGPQHMWWQWQNANTSIDMKCAIQRLLVVGMLATPL